MRKKRAANLHSPLRKALSGSTLKKEWGWDDQEQRLLHDRRLSTESFRIVVVADVDVGFMDIVEEPDCPRVNQLFILPSFHSQGIGDQCMAQVIDEASQQ